MSRLADLLDLVHSDSRHDEHTVEEHLRFFEEIAAIASIDDIPVLLDALLSEKADFWTREMLAGPLCRLGGPELLKPLLTAFDRSRADGHDNDSFNVCLWELVESAPDESANVLRGLREQTPEISDHTIDWLLEFCSPNPPADLTETQDRPISRLRRMFRR